MKLPEVMVELNLVEIGFLHAFIIERVMSDPADGVARALWTKLRDAAVALERGVALRRASAAAGRGGGVVSDPWEALRFLTFDEAVTRTKLSGSAFGCQGSTPEGYPFFIVVAVAKPGNERAVEWAREFHEKMREAAEFAIRVDRDIT